MTVPDYRRASCCENCKERDHRVIRRCTKYGLRVDNVAVCDSFDLSPIEKEEEAC